MIAASCARGSSVTHVNGMVMDLVTSFQQGVVASVTPHKHVAMCLIQPQSLSTLGSAGRGGASLAAQTGTHLQPHGHCQGLLVVSKGIINQQKSQNTQAEQAFWPQRQVHFDFLTAPLIS